uniref:Uncharacterized protein n=1 Tax=Salmonella sp. TaxID=599 RepID=A0A482ETA4_SALSP|nr:hypothetical protein [Salmonella sp.]QBM91438.1 hypothetical protein NNIBIDOC_00108 [Salmonella sp.]
MKKENGDDAQRAHAAKLNIKSPDRWDTLPLHSCWWTMCLLMKILVPKWQLSEIRVLADIEMRIWIYKAAMMRAV